MLPICVLPSACVRTCMLRVLLCAVLLDCTAPEVENQNRELTAAAQSAAADSQEVAALVAKHTKLEAAHKELQVRQRASARERISLSLSLFLSLSLCLSLLSLSLTHTHTVFF